MQHIGPRRSDPSDGGAGQLSPSDAAAVLARFRPTWTDRPLPLPAILGPLMRGRGDPASRWCDDGSLWLAMRTPEGSASLHLMPRSDEQPGTVELRGYGPGAHWAVRSGPALLGARDEIGGFEPRHRLIAQTWRRLRGHRIPRTDRLWEALLPAVLEQRVTGKESRRAWRRLVVRHGEPAPGSGSAGSDGPAPEGLFVPPGPRQVRRLSDWEWHGLGVDGDRRRAVRAVATVGDSLERLAATTPVADLARALRSVPGIGPWTCAETLQRAVGHTDAVSVGDYHLASYVGRALIGRPVTDEQMLALLEAYGEQRYRAVRMLELSGFAAPRFGPRMAVQDMSGI